MPRFEIKWTECVGYRTVVDAKDAAEAQRMFDAGEINSCEPDGFCETETDSVEIKEKPLTNEGN